MGQQLLKFPGKFQKDFLISTKCVKTSWHDLEGWLTTYHGLWYIILNQQIMALTTSKDFRIAPCIAEISGCWKCPLGLNHPVQRVFNVSAFKVIPLTSMKTFQMKDQEIMPSTSSQFPSFHAILQLGARSTHGSELPFVFGLPLMPDGLWRHLAPRRQQQASIVTEG